MRTIIIEDQPPAQRILKKYLQDLGTLELCAVFTDAVSAVAFLQRERVDLIFLDIHLPGMSGIEFLRSLADPPVVILTTAFSDYALESYEFRVADYLLKPFSFPRFVRAVNKAGELLRQSAPAAEASLPPPDVYIKSGHEHLRVTVAEILYLKSDADYTEVVTAAKKYLSTDPLRQWLERLAARRFVRVHKSYVVNAGQIVKVAGNQVYLPGGVVVPIGRAYKEDFMRDFVS